MLGNKTWILPLTGKILVAQFLRMAISHGNKTYFQILLDPNRAQLIEVLARSQKIKPTSWIRNTLYEHLNQTCEELYNDAVEKDKQAKEDARARRRQRFEQNKQILAESKD